MTAPARMWAVDLHVHTPGSIDASAQDYGSATDIVAAAVAAGISAIAITDHRTAIWAVSVDLPARLPAILIWAIWAVLG